MSCIINVYCIVTITAELVLSFFVLCNLKVVLNVKECSEECIGDLGPHSHILYSLTPETESSFNCEWKPVLYNRNTGYVDGLLPVYIIYINTLIHCQSLK